MSASIEESIIKETVVSEKVIEKCGKQYLKQKGHLGKEYNEKNRKINEQNIHFLKRNGPFSLKSLSRKKKNV